MELAQTRNYLEIAKTKPHGFTILGRSYKLTQGVCVVMSRYASAGDALASVLYRNYHARCRYRAEELRPGCYAVVERGTSVIVLSGFPSCEAAWSWIANRLGARYEDWPEDPGRFRNP